MEGAWKAKGMAVYHKRMSWKQLCELCDFPNMGNIPTGPLNATLPCVFFSSVWICNHSPVLKCCNEPVSLTTRRLIPNFLSLRAHQMMVNRTTEVYRLTSSFYFIFFDHLLNCALFNTDLKSCACQNYVSFI